VVVAGVSSWVAEIGILMIKPIRFGNLFYIGLLWIGLLFASCSLFHDTAINPTATITPTLAGTVPVQPYPQPGEPVMSLDLSGNQGNKQILTSLIWLPDGRLVLSGSEGISLYQMPKAGLQPQGLPMFQSQIVAENPTLLTSTPDGLDLAWITAERTVVYWNISQAVNAAKISDSDSPITGLTLNPKRKDLAYSTLKGEVLILGSESQKIIRKWQQKFWLSDLCFSPDGQYLAGIDPSSFSATIYTQDGQVIKQLQWAEAVNPSLFGAFFSPDWKKLAWVSQSAVQFMDVATGKTTVLLSHEDAVGAIAWAPNSTLFATS
jgi:WD40 repeat protein